MEDVWPPAMAAGRPMPLMSEPHPLVQGGHSDQCRGSRHDPYARSRLAVSAFPTHGLQDPSVHLRRHRAGWSLPTTSRAGRRASFGRSLTSHARFGPEMKKVVRPAVFAVAALLSACSNGAFDYTRSIEGIAHD